WLRRTNPALLARVGAVLAPKDYLGLKLTGEQHTDHVDAAGTGLYDLSVRGWSAELAELAGIPASALPPILDSTSVAGSLTGASAETLGLPPGLPVLAGVGDDVELLGATSHREKVAVKHLGTTGSILITTPSATARPIGRVEVYPTCVTGTLAAGISTSNAGSVVNWIEKVLGVRLTQALQTRRSQLVAVPFLFGERGTIGLPFANGAIIGIDGSTDRIDIANAFVLGIVFGLRDLLATVTSTVAGIDELVASGGGAAPLEWVRLRASVYGVPIDVMEGDPTAVGCAALGLAALDGARPDEVARQLDRKLVTVEPDKSVVARMNDRFNAYLDARDALLSGFATDGRPLMVHEAELA